MDENCRGVKPIHQIVTPVLNSQTTASSPIMAGEEEEWTDYVHRECLRVG